MESARLFGGSTPVLLASFDPVTSSSRTFQLSLLEAVSESWTVLPRSGMTRSGRAFELVTWGPRTVGIGSGLLPTPAATEYGTNQGGAAGRSGPVRPSLSTMARRGLWPTPHGFAKEEYKRRQGPSGNELGRRVFQEERKKLIPTPTAKDADSSRNSTAVRSDGQEHHSGETLTDFVTLWPTPTAADGDRTSETFIRGNPTLLGAVREQETWPTPTARDYKDTGDLRSVPENGLLPRVVQRVENERMWPTPRSKDGNGAAIHGDGGLDLTTAVEDKFPTPTGSNRDNAGGSGSRKKAKEDGTYISGKLNPQFVEWLMGLPLDWTKVDED